MKKNLIKTILSLWVLTLLAMSGMASAQTSTYDVTIGNLNGYWVLNLGRLIMRNSAGNEWIVIDWGFAWANTDYVIKIWQYAGNDSLSKIRVSNICKRDWTDCKSVADLTTWVTINGTNGLICVKVNDKEINCNKTVINNNPTLTWWQQKTIGTVWGTGLTVIMPANPHIEWTNIVGTSENATTNANTTNTTTYLNHVENNITTSSTQIKWAGATTVTASNWDITITSKDTKWRTVVSNTQNWTTNSNTTNPYLNYVDERNGSDAVVNGIQIHWGGYTTVESNGNVITISSTPWPGNELHYTGKNVLGNNNNPAGNQTTQNSNTYLYHVENDQVLSNIQIKWSGATSVASSNGVLTISSTDNNTTYSAATSSTLGLVKLWSDTQQTQAANTVSSTAWKTYAIQKNSAGQLVVNVPRQGGTYTAGNGLILSSSQFAAKLKNTTKSAYAATDNIGSATKSDKLYAVGMDKDGYLAVHVPRTDTAWWWDTIWSTGSQTYMGDYITPKDAKTVWFGNKDTTTIYFWQLLGGWKLKFQKYWLHAASSPVEFNAAWAKFWVNSSLARENNIGWVSIAWALVVWNTSSDNYIYIIASWNAWANNRHYEIRANKELSVWVNEWSYLYFKNYNDNNNEHLKQRIWVNSTNPQATFDVNGSIRVNTALSPCVPTTCTDANRWTIVYTDAFYWCTEDWWKKFSMTSGSPNFTNYVCQTALSSPRLAGSSFTNLAD